MEGEFSENNTNRAVAKIFTKLSSFLIE